MKKMLRVSLIALALILCLIPAFVSCDSKEPAGNESGSTAQNDQQGSTDISTLEGRKISSFPNLQKTMRVTMYQIEDTNGKESVSCSLVLYDNDGKVLNSTTLKVKVNGQDAQFSCFHKATWHDDKVEITVLDHDGVKTTYTLKYAP
jgi:hypothetical protein